MNDIILVHASLEYAEFFCKAVDFVARERKYLAALEGFPLESTKKFVGFITANNLAQFYALLDGDVIGWCDILPKGYEGMRHVGVLGMGLLPEYRGKGLGGQLLEKTIEHAHRVNGIEKVELEVYGSNSSAISFYKKYGFEVEGKRLKARKLDDIYDDMILMGKFI